MILKALATVALVGLAATVGAAPQQPTLEITPLANEGVLITAGDTRVIIDGLFRPYDGYPVLPEADRDRVETGRAPFQGVDLILVSHLHGDHFHPESVARHLRHNPGASLISSVQITSDVRKYLGRDIAIGPRIQSVTPGHGERVAVTAAGVNVEVLGLRHGIERFKWVQNLGHVVTIGGKKVLHIGDADTDIAVFERLALDRQHIDVALLPGWFLTDRDGQRIIREYIKPRHLVAVHLPPAESAQHLAAMRLAFPQADAFTAPGATRRY